jgi:hypothetical protein
VRLSEVSVKRPVFATVISLMLVIIVTGVNLWTLISEVRRHTARLELMRELSKDEGESEHLLPPGG